MLIAKSKMEQYRVENYDIDIQESITKAVIDYEVIPPGMSFTDSKAKKTVIYITEEE